MKKYFFLYATICCAILSGCCNSDEQSEGKFTKEERAKIELAKTMFLENGWELDSTVSDEERDWMLLNANVDELRDFAENFCWDNTVPE